RGKAPESSSKMALLPSDTGPKLNGDTGANTGPQRAEASSVGTTPASPTSKKAVLLGVAGLAVAAAAAGILLTRPRAPETTTPVATAEPSPATTTCVLTVRAEPAN